MSLGKWSFGSRNRSTASSGKGDMSSSSSTTGTSSPGNKRGSGSGGNSNRSSKASSSSSPTSSSSSFSWFRSSNRSKRKSIISRDDPAFARLHKPFTPQNLEHQKMLSTFEWTFDDDRDCRRRRRTSLSISPCASRNATVDDYAPDCGYGYGAQEDQHSHEHVLPPNGRQNTLSGPFAGLSMREASGEGSDQENNA